MTHISDPTQTFTIPITQEGKTYSFRLKLNLKDAKESTGKLTDENQKTHQVAKNNIIWQGQDMAITTKQLSKKIKEMTLSLDLKPTNNPSTPFDVYLGTQKEIQSQPSTTQKNIVSVQTLIEFIKLFKEQSSSLMDLFKQMVTYFCKAPSLDSADVEEIISLSEFLSSEEQTHVICRIRKDNSFELLAAAIKALKITKPSSRIEEEIINLIRSYADLKECNPKPFLQFAKSLPLEMRSKLESQEARSILNFLNEFCSHLHLPQTEEKLKKTIENVKIVKSWLYCGKHDANVFPVHQERSQAFQELINLPNNNSSTVTFSRILMIRTLLDINFIVSELPIVLDISFIKSEIPINESTVLDTLSLGEIGKAKEGNYYFTAFLLQNSRQLLKLNSEERNWLKTITQPWLFLKNTGNELTSDSTPIFTEIRNHINLISNKKKLMYFYLFLLQNAYLKENPDIIKDFNEFSDDLTNPEKIEKNRNFLPFNKRYEFVLGLTELLDCLVSTSTIFETRTKSLQLLKMILDNNRESVATSPILYSASPLLFRIKSSSIRRYIVKKIEDILAAEEKKPSGNNPNTENLSQVFLKTLQNKFPLLFSLRCQLERLKKDSKFIEDSRYMVEIMAQRPKETKPRLLSELIDERIFLEKKLIVISAFEGAGKTLFLKSYVQNLLENYQLGKPFPFYLSLESLKNPQSELMKNSIQLLNLGHCEEELRNSNTIWFLDDAEKVFKRDNALYNIYRSNQLMEEWPNAQFIFACDSRGFSTEDMIRYFTSEDISLQKLEIVPFDENEIERFLESYIKIREANGMPFCSKEVYRKGIEHLGLKNIPHTIKFFRQAADCLTELQNEINFDNQQSSILESWIAKSIKHAAKNSSEGYFPNEYLGYLIDVQRLMQICGIRSVQKAEGPMDSVKADMQDLLFGKKKKFYVDAFFKTNSQGAIEYRYPLLYNFLKEIRTDSQRKQNLQQLLSV